MHDVELQRGARLLANGKHLEPSHALDLTDNQAEVGPVNSRERRLEVDLKALELGLLLIVLHHLLLLESAQPVGLGSSRDSLPQRVVLVNDKVLIFLVLRVNLEEQHLTFHLRERMSNQNEVLVQLVDARRLEDLKLAVVGDVVLEVLLGASTLNRRALRLVSVGFDSCLLLGNSLLGLGRISSVNVVAHSGLATSSGALSLGSLRPVGSSR
mmetsp:Transcript_15670/g.24022  ORF Transcript_15670/g.24022 Transcript_15670/m.24022 type:complete len:212 (+) Transcript_15670:626-1261(+)